MQPTIFLSYSSKDRERLLPLIQSLEKEGFDLWWDQEIPIGKTYDQVIEERLKKSKVVLVIWSKNSTASNWVKAEASVARDANKMIPILLEQTKVPLGFSRLQTADLSEWKAGEEHGEYDRVVREIKILLQRPVVNPKTGKKSFVPYILIGVLLLGLFFFLFWKMNQPEKVDPEETRIIDESLPDNDGSLSGVTLDRESSIPEDPGLKPNKNIESIKKSMGKNYIVEMQLKGKWQFEKKMTKGVESNLKELYSIMEFKGEGKVEFTSSNLSTVKRKSTYKITNKMIAFSTNGKLDKVMNIEKLTGSELHLSFLDSKSKTKPIVTVEMQYKKIK